MAIGLTFVTERLTEIDQARQSCCDNRSSWRDVQVVDRSGDLAVGLQSLIRTISKMPSI